MSGEEFAFTLFAVICGALALMEVTDAIEMWLRQRRFGRRR